MGETYPFQPLTREDKITVILYRAGIVISTLTIICAAYVAYKGMASADFIISGFQMNLLLLLLYFSAGLSVFFIHLYVGKFHRVLKNIYYLAVACLIILFLAGKGNPVISLFRTPPYSALLLIPLSLCLGFVTVKEAFCFRLVEGYLLGMIMPAYLFFYGIGILDRAGASYGLGLIAVLLALFTLRKVFQPVHYDIGDKSAYQP